MLDYEQMRQFFSDYMTAVIIFTFLALRVVHAVYSSRRPFPVIEGSAVIEIKSVSQLQELQAGDMPMVIDAFATWCPPCKQAARPFALASIKHKGTVIFGKVDVDAAGEVAKHLNVRSMPSFFLFSGMQEVRQFAGWNEGRFDVLCEAALEIAKGDVKKDQ